MQKPTLLNSSSFGTNWFKYDNPYFKFQFEIPVCSFKKCHFPHSLAVVKMVLKNSRVSAFSVARALVLTFKALLWQSYLWVVWDE
jgi:hypothetical protein